MTVRPIVALLIVLALLPPSTLAAEAQSCSANPLSRALDYWLGGWAVSYPGGPKGSTSKVELRLDKCLLVEQWGDRTGHRGENVFAYGQDDQTWHGLFADNHGRLHVFVEGKVVAGTAEFIGPSRGDDGGAVLNRVRLIRLDANTLKQTWDKSVDGGHTWKPDFALNYSRASAKTAPVVPTVRLATGALEGVRFGTDPHAAAFLGVPYAAPPTGPRRWQAPQDVPAWTGIRKATAFGAACPQLPASWLPAVPWSEDCLFLNVWSDWPVADMPPQPVMVYFHGGANTAGYSQLNPLGPALSRSGIVFVSANYRLGPFGFLAHPSLTEESAHHASGNYGLMDQIQALKWVHENIERFGGDPAQVTVMGQSAGAVDICLLMISPHARGLLQRAILESGDCQGVLNEERVQAVHYNQIPGPAEVAGRRLAQDLHVANDSNTAANLRAISAASILRTWSQDRTIHFSAIVDGWVIPEQPAKSFAEGTEMAIPVLIGSNADEATVFANRGPTSRDEYLRYLRADTGPYSGQELAAYPVTTDAQVPGRYLQLQNESFAYGAYSMARALARIGQRTYLYRLSYRPTGQRPSFGAFHGEELYFLSDALPRDWKATQKDASFGASLRSYWTRFAKTGDPNSAATPPWPSYQVRTDLYLDLGSDIQLKPVEARIHTLEAIMKKVTTR